jgi:hypothetical protein
MMILAVDSNVGDSASTADGGKWSVEMMMAPRLPYHKTMVIKEDSSSVMIR